MAARRSVWLKVVARAFPTKKRRTKNQEAIRKVQNRNEKTEFEIKRADLHQKRPQQRNEHKNKQNQRHKWVRTDSTDSNSCSFKVKDELK
ncbi:hypothetical protein SDJN02_16550, partial [Cucurbita argyrosperma subsp. argyrosperma]